jgi:hypothetical protein
MTIKLNISHLVLKIYGRIEVWDFSVDGFADDFAFASMEEGSHLYLEQLVT